jgi:iron complex transport system permease protein
LSKKKVLFLILLPLVLFLISLFIGRYYVSPATALKIIFEKILPFLPIKPDWPEMTATVVLQIRLPRALLALLVGSGLSISGGALQGMFRNPLVSPDILGVSAASGFGAALAILISGNPVLIEISAFVFGIIGVCITYFASRIYKTTPVLMLVLSGVVIAALFSALISGVKYIADPYEKLPAITFWLMGSLNGTSIKDLLTFIVPMFIGVTGLLLVSWRINVLAMGDEEARSLGVKTETLKGIVIFCTTIITAAAVCVSGIIGWVGLIIPHVGRMMAGPNHRVLLPATLSLGASYLLIIDNIARTVTSTDIPLGILTAVLGAPFFLFLLRRTKGGWK